MKKYECVELTNYTQIAYTIKEYLENGWHLHTYQAVGHESTRSSTHYLLFEK